MSITVADIEVENHECDARGDVLYVDVPGYKGPSLRACASPGPTVT